MQYGEVNRPQNLLGRLGATDHGDAEQQAWSEQLRAEEQEMADRIVRMGELMASGASPGDSATLDELDWYYRSANQYVGVNAEMFAAVGDLLVEDERSRTLLEEAAVGLADYMRDAFRIYVDARLTEGGA